MVQKFTNGSECLENKNCLYIILKKNIYKYFKEISEKPHQIKIRK